MIKLKKINKSTFLRMEEIHTLPLMLLALFPVFFVLTDIASGIVLGLATVLGFLILEGSMFWIGRYLDSGWRETAYFIMLVAIAGIMGIFLQLMLFKRIDLSPWAFIIEQMTSIYIVRKLYRFQSKKEEQVQKIETEAKANRYIILREFLTRFEVATEYMVFLVLLGFLREFMGKWIGLAQLLSGGFLLTAGLLFLWKLTKTMPEKFRKLPRYTLSVGLILLVLAGFVGLL